MLPQRIEVIVPSRPLELSLIIDSLDAVSDVRALDRISHEPSGLVPLKARLWVSRLWHRNVRVRGSGSWHRLGHLGRLRHFCRNWLRYLLRHGLGRLRYWDRLGNGLGHWNGLGDRRLGVVGDGRWRLAGVVSEVILVVVGEQFIFSGHCG